MQLLTKTCCMLQIVHSTRSCKHTRGEFPFDVTFSSSSSSSFCFTGIFAVLVIISCINWYFPKKFLFSGVGGSTFMYNKTSSPVLSVCFFICHKTMVRNKFSVNYFIQMKKLLFPIVVVVVVKQEIAKKQIFLYSCSCFVTCFLSATALSILLQMRITLN